MREVYSKARSEASGKIEVRHTRPVLFKTATRTMNRHEKDPELGNEMGEGILYSDGPKKCTSIDFFRDPFASDGGLI